MPDSLAAPELPAAILRGTSRGLEVVVDGAASVAAITSDIMKRIDEAPAFFRGSDVRIRVEDGPLPPGCLARLDEIAMMFELRIVEVTAAKRSSPDALGTSSRARTEDPDAVPEPNLAAGSAPAPAFDDEAPTHANAKPLAVPPPAPELLEAAPLIEDLSALVAVADEAANFEEPTQSAAPLQLGTTPEADQPSTGTRVVVGPVRSGVILEHFGHLIIFGDVNPGAEVRCTGNIIVLGRLRGTAHAGISQEVGFILALRLEPQQLRIGRKVARAADSDAPASEPEIAYGTGDNVVVERYLGKLPRNLATSL
ncbi:MAG TPA: septum site-determining protein MinC [Kofleriaceae bacterium]